jgi:hypothetical protein
MPIISPTVTAATSAIMDWRKLAQIGQAEISNSKTPSSTTEPTSQNRGQFLATLLKTVAILPNVMISLIREKVIA